MRERCVYACLSLFFSLPSLLLTFTFMLTLTPLLLLPLPLLPLPPPLLQGLHCYPLRMKHPTDLGPGGPSLPSPALAEVGTASDSPGDSDDEASDFEMDQETDEEEQGQECSQAAGSGYPRNIGGVLVSQVLPSSPPRSLSQGGSPRQKGCVGLSPPDNPHTASTAIPASRERESGIRASTYLRLPKKQEVLQVCSYVCLSHLYFSRGGISFSLSLTPQLFSLYFRR